MLNCQAIALPTTEQRAIQLLSPIILVLITFSLLASLKIIQYCYQNGHTKFPSNIPYAYWNAGKSNKEVLPALTEQ